jgi:hypothetical protein
MTIVMEDSSVFGPFTLPIAMLHWRGDWVADEDYNELDLVFVAGSGTYLVLRDHTSDPYEFDPNEVDSESNPLYFLLFPVPDFNPSSFNLQDIGNVLASAPTDGMILEYSAANTVWAAVVHQHIIDFYREGTIPPSQVIWRWVSIDSFYLNNAVAQITGYVPTPPSNTVNCQLRLNGSQIGTLSFDAFNNLATASLTSPQQIAPFDVLDVFAPANATSDALADLSVTLALYKGVM